MARHSNYKTRQALNNLNRALTNLKREAQKADAANRRFVQGYNRVVREHNARIRAHQQRLMQELAKLSSRPTRVVYRVTYRSSVQTLVQSFQRIEQSSELGTWRAGDEIFDLAERETANSVAVLNALEGAADDAGDEADDLQETIITTELQAISPDLDDRWRGALFALNPRNPDAARHFCTSAREILVKILDLKAPDRDVMAAWAHIQLTQGNQVPRREKIRYCLALSGHQDEQLQVFVEDDINNVMALFGEFNPATHGEAGKYSLTQLGAIKTRVEGAIQFLHRIVTS